MAPRHAQYEHDASSDDVVDVRGGGRADGDPFVVNDGKMFFYPNWFNTSRLGQLRERVFVAAPLSYSAYRFATSLRGNKGYSSY